MKKNAFFLQRMNDHVQYLRKIKARIEGTSDFNPCDHHCCALGQWFYSDGYSQAAIFGDRMLSLYQQLEEPHQQFHHASSLAVACHELKDEVGSYRAMTQMHRLSTQLINIILEMDRLASRAAKQREAS